jgi:hypothetical protein
MNGNIETIADFDDPSGIAGILGKDEYHAIIRR